MATESASAIGHASSWGYACFLTVNATSVWGGIFPFLPLEFQTVEVTLTFFLTQAVAFGGAFLASMLGSYFFPYGARRMLVSLSAVLLFLGSACLITAMYVASAAIAFVGAGGVLLGIGCAGMFMLWQRYFASLDARTGNFRLIVGTAIAPFIYLALYLVPIGANGFSRPPDLRASVRSVRGTFGARDELRAAHVRGRPASAPARLPSSGGRLLAQCFMRGVACSGSRRHSRNRSAT